MKLFGRLLQVIGCILIATFAVSRIDSELGSRIALAQLAKNPAAGQATTSDASIDFSLWSDKRIAAFRESLGMTAAPAIAALRVPRLGINAPVFEGSDEVTLNRGVGWIAGTATPGKKGNVALAAHRDGFFRALKDIAVDDVIELETNGRVEKYVVRSLSIVEPTNVSVLAPTNDAALTLVTCYPFYFVGSAPQRFIVHATAASPPAARAGATGPQNQNTSAQ